MNITIKGVRKIILYALTFLILSAFSLGQMGHPAETAIRLPAPIKIADKPDEKDMSAIKFTALPFILAFKHFVLDREE